MKYKKQSKWQDIRDLQNSSQNITLSPDELLAMPSFQEYIREDSSPERAIRRARERRRRMEEYENELSQFSPEENIARSMANKQLAGGSPISDREVLDELILQDSEKKQYMPDDVFEKTINKQVEEPSSKKYMSVDPHTEGYGGSWLADWFTKYIFHNVAAPVSQGIQNEEKLEAYDEFNQYSRKAQEDAYRRYLKKNGITEKQIEEDGVNPMNKPEETPQMKMYHALTSPLGDLAEVYRRAGKIKFDPKLNPEHRFGSAGYWNDAWTTYLTNLNEAQINAFQGKIDRTGEVEELGNRAVQYQRVVEQFDGLRNQLSEVEQQMEQAADSGNYSQYNILSRAKDTMTQALSNLLTEMSALKEYNDKFKEYIPDDILDRTVIGISAVASKIENAIFGTHLYDWTSPIFDDTDPLRRQLFGFNDAQSADQKQYILNKYIAARKRKIEDWQRGIELNEEDKKRAEDSHTVSDYYKYWEQNASGNIFSGDTWAFKQPGLQGFSSSSWIKTLPMYLGGPASALLKAGRGVTAAVAGIGFVGAHSAAYDENFMELRENVKPVLERNIKRLGSDVWDKFLENGIKKYGLQDQDEDSAKQKVLDKFLNSEYLPKEDAQILNEAKANSLYGANALFDRDMMAVDLDNVVNTAVMFGTFGPLAKATKIVSPLADTVSPVVGVGKKAIGWAARQTKYGRQIAKKIDDIGTLLLSTPREIIGKSLAAVSRVGNTARGRLASRRLNSWAKYVGDPAKSLRNHTWWENSVKLVGAATTSMISEGVEEGKQYLAGQAFQRGDLKNAEVTFGFKKSTNAWEYAIPGWNILANIDAGKWYDDMLNGIHSAYVIAGIPFNLESTHAPELVENIKGGMMGGLFMTGMSSTATSAIDTYQQLKVNKYMLNNVIAEKAARTDLYEKAKLYAAHSFSREDSERMNAAFDRLAEINSRNQNQDWYIPEDIVEQQKRLFGSVYRMANNEDVQDRAKELNIEVGSDKYNQFIGQLALTEELFQEKAPQKKAVAQNLIQQITEGITDKYSIDSHGQVMLDIGTGKVPYTIVPKKNPDGTEESKEDAVARLNSNRSQNTELALYIKTLQDLLAQINFVDENTQFFGQSRSSLMFLKRRIEKYLNNKVELVKPEHREEFLKSIDTRVRSVENADQIQETYRKLTLLNADIDYASMMYKSLMGKNAIHSSVEESVSPNGVKLDYLYDSNDPIQTFSNIAAAYENRVKGDHALYDALEEDYVTRLEKLEDDERARIKAEAERNNPLLAEEERLQNLVQENQKPQTKDYIPVTVQDTSKDVYDTVLNVAKTIYSGKSSKTKAVKQAFTNAGVSVDKQYTGVVMNASKQLVNGEITPQQFALLFVGKNDRQKYTEQSQQGQPQQEPQTTTQQPEQKQQQQPAGQQPEQMQPQSKPQPTPTTKPSAQPTVQPAPQTQPKPQPAPQPQPQKPVQKPQQKPTQPAQQNVSKGKTLIENYKKAGVELSDEDRNILNSVEDDSEFLKEKQAELNDILELRSLVNEDSYGEKDFKIMAAGSKVIARYFKRGIINFDDVGKQLLKDIGEAIRPHLKMIYSSASTNEEFRQYWNDMSDQDYVRSVDLNTFDKKNSDEHEKQVKSAVEILQSTEKDVLDIIAHESSETYSEQLRASLSEIVQKMEDVRTQLSKNGYSEQNIKTARRLIRTARNLIKQTQSINQTQQPSVSAPSVDLTYDEMLQISVDQQLLVEKEIRQTIDNALSALSYYMQILNDGEQFTKEDISSINKWIASLWDKERNSCHLEFLIYYDPRLANDGVYKILEYVQAFRNIGITGDEATLPEVITLKQMAYDGLTRDDYNAVFAKGEDSLQTSVAVDDPKIHLEDFTSEEGFLENVQAEFKLGGRAHFDDKLQDGQQPRVYVVFTYKGHTFTPVKMWEANTDKISENNSQLAQTVINLITNNPGKKVVPVLIGRSRGVVKDQPNGIMVNLKDAGLVTDEYAVSFDNLQEEFMLTRATPVSGGRVVIQATRPSNDEGKGVSSVYTYSAANDGKPMAGNVVYMKKVEGSDKPYMPINLYRQEITEGDADLIIGILRGEYSTGQMGPESLDKMFVQDGYEMGLTNRQVLNFLLPFGKFGEKGKPLVHVGYSKYEEGVVVLSGKFEGETEYKKRSFDLRTDKGRDDFKKFLMTKVRKNISEYIMKQSLGAKANQLDSPMRGLYEFLHSVQGKQMREHLEKGGYIQFGKSSIVFDKNDISDSKRKGELLVQDGI